MIIKKKATEAKWFEFNEDVSFEVRPFPFSHFRSEGVVGSMAEQFGYCLVGWKGIKDEGEDGEVVDFEFTAENVKYLFDYSGAIREFVLQKAEELTAEVEKQIKN